MEKAIRDSSLKKEEYEWYMVSKLGFRNLDSVTKVINSLLYDASDKTELRYLAGKILSMNKEELILSGLKDQKKYDSLLEDMERVKADDNIFLEYSRLADKGIEFIARFHDKYPDLLNQIYLPPVGLYVYGRSDCLLDFNKSFPRIAMVGARNCTEYGKKIAFDLARDFTCRGNFVVSGMAVGIDKAAHEGALSADGATIAVLGCGVDICYPRTNIGLYRDIVEEGVIISEYEAGTPAYKSNFPQRNRIISGMCEATLVVEARKRSGSLITAADALNQDRLVCAVPGRIGDPLSEGCNELLLSGASPITKPKDLYDLFEIELPKNLSLDLEKVKNNMDDSEENITYENIFLERQKNLVYSVVNLYPETMDSIIEKTGMDVASVGMITALLLMEGKLKETSPNTYIRS